MRRAGLLVGFIAAAALLGQTDSLPSRLHRVLAESDQLDSAAAALAGGNYGKVEQILEKAEVRTPQANAERLCIEAAVEFLAKDMSRAAATYAQAAGITPLSDADSFTFAMALANTGDIKKARELITNLYAAHPSRALYVYWLGRLDYYERRYARATDEFAAATRLDPQSVRAWDNLGLAFDMQGRMNEALDAFQQAVTLNRSGSHPSAWPPNNLGSLLLRMERPVEAEAALRESIRYDSALAQAHYRLGQALEKQNRDPEAVEQYRIAVSGDSTSPDACYRLAFLLRKMHKEKEASAMFTEFSSRKRRENALSDIPVPASK